MEEEIKTNTQGMGGSTPPNIPVSPNINMTGPELSTGSMPKDNIDDLIGNGPKSSENKSFYYDPAKPPVPLSSTNIPTGNPQPVDKPISTPAPAPKKMEARDFGLGKNGGKKNKTILIAVISAVVLVLGIVAYFIYAATIKQYPVTVTVNPPDAQVSVNTTNKKATNGKLVVNLKKGSYDITASKEGYATVKKNLTVKGVANESISFDLVQVVSFAPVLNQAVMFPVINKDLNTIIYFEKGSQWTAIKEYNVVDKSTVTLIDGLPDVAKVAWSKTYRQVAVKITNTAANKDSKLPYQEQFGEGTVMNWVLDLDRKDLVNVVVKPLNPAIKNVSFSPDGNKIAYFYNNGTRRTIATANIDGSAYENIINIETIKFEPDVVWSADGRRVAIFADSAGGETDVYTYNFETRSTSKLSEGGKTYGGVFSPDASKILYNSSGKLVVYDFEKDEATASLNTGVEAELSSSNWVSGDTIIAITANKSMMRIRTTGIKESIDINQASLPANITGILFDASKVYLVGDTGVFEVALDEII